MSEEKLAAIGVIIPAILSGAAAVVFFYFSRFVDLWAPKVEFTDYINCILALVMCIVFAACVPVMYRNYSLIFMAENTENCIQCFHKVSEGRKSGRKNKPLPVTKGKMPEK